jgi:hypothetical protein
VSAFHDDWAQLNNGNAHWFNGKHDVAKYPLFTDAGMAANRKELDAFFEEVAYSGGSFKDLLLSNVAFVNKDNAAIYGEDPAKYTDALTKVTLASGTNTTPRPGFLTRAGFLGSYSDYDSTSPILRGSFIAIWLLSKDVPAPDPANTKKTVSGNFTTQREYTEALTMNDGACKGCHQGFNGIGYVLENYDGIGKWQTKDLKGGNIDAAVTTATVTLGADGPKTISSPAQLMEEIAKQPKAKELYAQAWVSFAYGRPKNANDQCVVDKLNLNLTNNADYTILGLLGDLTQTESFSFRVRGAQ